MTITGREKHDPGHHPHAQVHTKRIDEHRVVPAHDRQHQQPGQLDSGELPRASCLDR